MFGLCDSCIHQEVIRNTRGSLFSLCERSKTDPHFPKYPRVPVLECQGHEAYDEVECEWVPLDERAIHYAREQLDSSHALARICLDLLDETRPWAHLPVGTPPESLYPMSGGAGFPFGQDARPLEALFGFLSGQDEGWRRLIVFADTAAKPTTPYIAEGRTYVPAALFGNDVMYVITQPGDPPDPLQFGPFPGWQIIGVASRVPAQLGIPDPGSEVDSEFMKHLADQVFAVMVGAWDMENWVVLDRGLLASVAGA